MIKTTQEQPLFGDALLRKLQTQPGPYDGHTHTIVSDGHETLLGLCRMAAAMGISHLAISDHDFNLHPRKARVLSLMCGIDVIPAVELNVIHPVGDRKVLLHLGLLWVPTDDEELNALLRHNQELPQDVYPKAMLQNLYELGLDPSGEGVERSYEMLLERNPGCQYMGKGPVSDLLVETGQVSSREEVSKRYLGEHGERLAWVDKTQLFDFITLEQILTCLRRLNRERDTAVISTLNHPFHYGLEPDVLKGVVADYARLGGHAVEVYYPKHDQTRENLLLDWCSEFGLVPNAGSDYHYDAHKLMCGDPQVFETLRRLHNKEISPNGKEW